MKSLSLFALLSWLAAGFVQANWPEFRGPTADGHVPAESKLPLKWSETENIKWKTAIHDKGWSTPVIWGDQVWLTTATEDGKHQYGVCVDKNTGKILFDQELFHNEKPDPLGNTRNTYASPSPVIEDGRVYLHFGSYGTACLDTKTFKVIWQRRDMPCNHWRGPASSPVIYGDLLILTFDGADYHYTTALNKITGETVWKRDRSTDYKDLGPDGKPSHEGDYRKAFNTPTFLELNGQMQMISPGAKAVWSYDPKTGDEIWSAHFKEHSTASRTVYSKELGLMYVNTGYGKAELWALRIDPNAKGEISESHLAWKVMKRTANRCSPVLVGDRFYMVSDGGIASSLNAKTGDEIWSDRVGETLSASIIYGNGHLYFFDEMGVCSVVKPGDTFNLAATNKLDTGMFACPSADGNALYVRTTTHLYRIEE